MRLHRLSLRHFKGIRSFDLEPDGANVDVYGSNAAGKTTLADAWTGNEPRLHTTIPPARRNNAILHEFHSTPYTRTHPE